jgi:hypothetical protein
MCLLAPLCSATVAPITSVTTDNPPGNPPYNLESITVGNYTVQASRLLSAGVQAPKWDYHRICGSPCRKPAAIVGRS